MACSLCFYFQMGAPSPFPFLFPLGTTHSLLSEVPLWPCFYLLHFICKRDYRYSEKERTHRNVSLALLSPAKAVSALWRPEVL